MYMYGPIYMYRQGTPIYRRGDAHLVVREVEREEDRGAVEQFRDFDYIHTSISIYIYLYVCIQYRQGYLGKYRGGTRTWLSERLSERRTEGPSSSFASAFAHTHISIYIYIHVCVYRELSRDTWGSTG